MFKVTAIIPDTLLIDLDKLIEAVNLGLDEAAKYAKSQLELPLETWNTPVEINIDTPEPYARFIGTEDILYSWINSGTKPHMIPLSPKTDGNIVYAKGGTPKTQPGVITAGQGSRGTEWRRRKQVLHPGITPRKFDEIVYEDMVREDILGKAIQENIDRVVIP